MHRTSRTKPPPMTRSLRSEVPLRLRGNDGPLGALSPIGKDDEDRAKGEVTWDEADPNPADHNLPDAQEDSGTASSDSPDEVKKGILTPLKSDPLPDDEEST